MDHQADALSPERCASLIEEAGKIVAMTGAGISTAAGIPDFRGPDGLYVTRRYDPDRVFEINGFRQDPKPFYEFTRDFMTMLEDIEPTFTHSFLAELEQLGKLTVLITQNIDPLHQQAGSRKVIPVHGGYWTSHCQTCWSEIGLEKLKQLIGAMEVPTCECGGVIKPDVVFFGEAVDGMTEAVAAVAEADLMLVLGSSLTVYPAAFLPRYAQCEVVVVNLGPVGFDPAAGRYFADAELDAFFEKVAAALGME